MGFDSGSFRVIFQGPPIKYRLYAVLVHSGYSSNSGHYYCYIRTSNGVWYQMNDSIVSEKHCPETLFWLLTELQCILTFQGA